MATRFQSLVGAIHTNVGVATDTKHLHIQPSVWKRCKDLLIPSTLSFSINCLTVRKDQMVIPAVHMIQKMPVKIASTGLLVHSGEAAFFLQII